MTESTPSEAELDAPIERDASGTEATAPDTTAPDTTGSAAAESTTAEVAAPKADEPPPAEVKAADAAPAVEMTPVAETPAVVEAPADPAPVAAVEATPAAATDAAPPTAAESAPKADKPSGGAAARGRPRRQLSELVVGEKLKGKVVGLSKFGAFVDIGATTDGLVHLTELPGKRVRTAEEAVSSGDSVEVFVKDVDLDKGRISLSMRSPSARPLGGLAVGDVVTGHVTTITKYGAFVDIGSETEGLVHISEMSSGFVSRPEDIVQAGAEVEVRVKELDLDRKRISLSMVGLAGDAAAQAQAEQRPRGGQPSRAREEEVYVPEEPAERMPTVVELALRRAMGDDVDDDEGERGKGGRGDKGKKAAQREMTDVYAKMLSDYRASKGDS